MLSLQHVLALLDVQQMASPPNKYGRSTSTGVEKVWLMLARRPMQTCAHTISVWPVLVFLSPLPALVEESVWPKCLTGCHPTSGNANYPSMPVNFGTGFFTRAAPFWSTFPVTFSISTVVLYSITVFRLGEERTKPQAAALRLLPLGRQEMS